MRKLIGSLLFSFVVAAANAANPIVMTVPVNQKQFSINLDSNPTTGYQWTLIKFDKTLLALTASQYIPATSKLMGAGGQMQFAFKLGKGKTYPLMTTMIFKYQRPWESEAGTLQTVNIKFQ